MKDHTIYEAFSQQVSKHKDEIAIEFGKRSLTYLELDKLVQAVVERFPVPLPERVGIVMDHSIEMIASILAVLKSGATYVPVEPSFPPERIRFVMEEASVDFIITNTSKSGLEAISDFKKLIINKDIFNEIDRISDNGIEIDTAGRQNPDSVAYILYTSGTTGRPKGVMVTNHNVVNYTRAFHNEFNIGQGDRMLQYSVCTFDIFVEEVMATLLNGATLVIAPKSVKTASVKPLMKFINSKGITIISGFPYLIENLNDYASELPSSLRLLLSGGDVLRQRYIDRLQSLDGTQGKVMVYNTYGPSETTVCATYQRCDNIPALEDGTFPIGHPVLGVEVEIMDDDFNVLPEGQIGEICIFGEGVSKGYARQCPESSNFTTTPDGRYVYRSGDLGYRLKDGSLAFLHRKDTQIMILGKRVECSEVQNVICNNPMVKDCYVTSIRDRKDLDHLVAFVVPNNMQEFSIKELRPALGQYLTSFMIPEFFVIMHSLPMTPNGKVDTKALMSHTSKLLKRS